MRIKLRYLVRSGGLNCIPSVRGPVRKIYTTPAFECLRINTRVEKASAQHSTTAHVMSLNRRAENFTS